MKKGVIYVMSTDIPGLVKIGKSQSDDFLNEMSTLEHNGYFNVGGLKRRFAIEVDDYNEKKRKCCSKYSARQGSTVLICLHLMKISL